MLVVLIPSWEYMTLTYKDIPDYGVFGVVVQISILRNILRRGCSFNQVETYICVRSYIVGHLTSLR